MRSLIRASPDLPRCARGDNSGPLPSRRTCELRNLRKCRAARLISARLALTAAVPGMAVTRWSSTAVFAVFSRNDPSRRA